MYKSIGSRLLIIEFRCLNQTHCTGVLNQAPAMQSAFYKHWERKGCSEELSEFKHGTVIE